MTKETGWSRTGNKRLFWWRVCTNPNLDRLSTCTVFWQGHRSWNISHSGLLGELNVWRTIRYWRTEHGEYFKGKPILTKYQTTYSHYTDIKVAPSARLYLSGQPANTMEIKWRRQKFAMGKWIYSHENGALNLGEPEIWCPVFAPQVCWLRTEEGEFDKELELFCPSFIEDLSPQRHFDWRMLPPHDNFAEWIKVNDSGGGDRRTKEGEYHWEIIWRDFKLHIQSLDIKLSAPTWRQLYGSLMSQEGWHWQRNHDRSIKLIYFWCSANWRRRGGNKEEEESLNILSTALFGSSMREKDSTQLLTHTDEDEDDDDEKWWWWRRTTVWKYCVPNERGKSTGIDYWVAINAFIRDWRPCPQLAEDWWLRLLVSAQTLEEGRGSNWQTTCQVDVIF